MQTTLLSLENAFLHVTIYEDASADIVVKETEKRWHMRNIALQEDNPVDVGHVWLRTRRSICEEYPAHFQGVLEGDQLRFTVIGREQRHVGTFTCRFWLDGPKLVVSLLEISETLPSLAFPPSLDSESLVLPMGVGRWVRQPLEERYIWVYPAHLNMRWFGGLQNGDGWLAVAEEGYADFGVLATQFVITPLWLKTLGTWSLPRTVSYQFVHGDYVTLAKTFRAYALEHGLHRSLSEKMEEMPLLQKVAGASHFSFMQAETVHPERFEERLQPIPEYAREKKLQVLLSHQQLLQILDQAERLGIKRGLVVVRGWCNGGYDEFHPDIWPPEEALGTIDELKEILHPTRDLVVALHDNYQDIYQQSPSWPHGVMRTVNGDPLPGGLWAGGQAYILNARDGLAYAQRNWPELKSLEPQAMFIDTTIAVQLCESYEQNNTLSRAQDLAYKIDLLRFYKEQGIVLGSEEGADFGMALVDWVENRHHRKALESIPLWSLVFHDAAFYARYGPGPLSPESSLSPAPRWLTDMLWGYMPLWDFRVVQQWPHLFDDSMVQKFVQDMPALEHVNAWHERIGSAEMLSHRYLSEDGEVEETTFASGASIIVNFAAEPRTVEGITIPAHNFHIRA